MRKCNQKFQNWVKTCRRWRVSNRDRRKFRYNKIERDTEREGDKDRKGNIERRGREREREDLKEK